MNHMGIIADGSRRWAKSKGLPIKAGYVQSLFAGENCCEWAIENGLRYLTFYSFSTENWKRDDEEIQTIFKAMQDWIETRKAWYKNKDIKISFIGRKDRIPFALLQACQDIEEYTKNCKTLNVLFCLDYGGRDEIVRAVQEGAKTEAEITKALTIMAPEPDVILRTGGQKRLSNFLLWQCAYSELVFIDDFFPELSSSLLDQVKENYLRRVRTYGGN